MCKWISIRVRDEEKVWNELVYCIEGTVSQWGKIMQYAYDLHVIVCKTFSRLSSAFDKVFREYLVQTVDRVKMAFSNLCRNDLTSVSLFAYHIYRVPCLKPRTIDRYEH